MLCSFVLVLAATGLKLVELVYFQEMLFRVRTDGRLGYKLLGGTVGGALHNDLMSGGVSFYVKSVARKFLFAGYCVHFAWGGLWGLTEPEPVCSSYVNE